MSRLILSLAILGLAAACAPSYGPISVQGFYAPTSSCKTPTSTDPMTASGTFDYSATALAKVAPVFFVAMILQANVAIAGNGGELDVSGTALDAAGRDVPAIDDMVLSYTSTPKLPIKGTTVPWTAIFPGQGANILTLSASAVDLLSTTPVGQSVADALVNSANAQTFQLEVNLDFRGHMSRSGTTISTGAVSFPIRLYQSTTGACTPIPVTDCVAPGQDGTAGCQ
jgi:hypothetical protein